MAHVNRMARVRVVNVNLSPHRVIQTLRDIATNAEIIVTTKAESPEFRVAVMSCPGEVGWLSERDGRWVYEPGRAYDDSITVSADILIAPPEK